VTELAGYKAVGPSVEFTLKCVYILLKKQKNVSKVTWDQLKTMLAVGFFDELKWCNEERDNLNKKILEALQTYIEKNNKFKDEDIKNASSAAYTLWVWINALVAYARTVEKVEPLKRDVEQKNMEYAKA